MKLLILPGKGYAACTENPNMSREGKKKGRPIGEKRSRPKGQKTTSNEILSTTTTD